MDVRINVSFIPLFHDLIGSFVVITENSLIFWHVNAKVMPDYIIEYTVKTRILLLIIATT